MIFETARCNREWRERLTGDTQRRAESANGAITGAEMLHRKRGISKIRKSKDAKKYTILNDTIITTDRRVWFSIHVPATCVKVKLPR